MHTPVKNFSKKCTHLHTPRRKVAKCGCIFKKYNNKNNPKNKEIPVYWDFSLYQKVRTIMVRVTGIEPAAS